MSLGTHADGALRQAVLLPTEGDGYVVPGPWRVRHSNYGTDELVGVLVRSMRLVSQRFPGGKAAIGDLSRRGGGASVEHRSHQNGRDVDIFYYASDRSDRPVRPGEVMLRFDAEGRAVRWSPAQGHRAPPQAVPPYRFDARRNWALIRTLLTDSDAEVQWIFVRRHLIALLMREAVRVGEDPAILARAAFLMHQPSDGDPHDDHMHVRFYCDQSDRSLGCVDKGPVRWWKKLWKYMAPPFGRPSERSEDLADTFLKVMRSELPTLFFRRPLSS